MILEHRLGVQSPQTKGGRAAPKLGNVARLRARNVNVAGSRRPAGSIGWSMGSVFDLGDRSSCVNNAGIRNMYDCITSGFLPYDAHQHCWVGT